MASPNSSIARVSIAIGMLLVLAALPFVARRYWGNGPPSVHSESAADQVPAGAEPMLPSSDRHENVFTRSRITSRLTRVLVTDEARNPIGGAGLWLLAAKQLVGYSAGAPGHLGTSDVHGFIPVPPIDEPATLVVGRAGYVAQRLRLVQAQDNHVVLSTAAPLTFTFVRKDTRQPVPNVFAVASTARLDDEWIDQMPEGDPGVLESSFVWSRSQSDGNATLGFLPQCVPSWRVHAPGLAVVGGPGLAPPDETEVTCPGHYVLELSPLLAAGYEVTNDTVGFVTGRIEGGVTDRGLASHHAGDSKRLLQKLFPHAVTYVIVPRRIEAPPVLILRIELARKGAHDLRLPFRPIEVYRVEGPLRIDANALPQGEAVRAAAVIIDLVNPDGSPVPGCELMIRGRTGSFFKLAFSGEATFLPSGDYTVVGTHNSVDSSLHRSREIRVRASAGAFDTQRISLQLSRQLYQVKLIDQLRLHDGIAEVHHSNGGRMNVALRGPETKIFVPAGRIEILTEVMRRRAIGAVPCEVRTSSRDGDLSVDLPAVDG